MAAPLTDLQLIELTKQILEENVTEQITPGNVKQLIIKLIESKESAGYAQQLISNFANSVNSALGQRLTSQAFNNFLIEYNQSINNVNIDSKLGSTDQTKFPLIQDTEGKLTTEIESGKKVKGVGGNFNSFSAMKAYYAAHPGLREEAMTVGVSNDYLLVPSQASYGGVLNGDSIYFMGIMDRNATYISGVTQFHIPTRTWRYFVDTQSLFNVNTAGKPFLFSKHLLFTRHPLYPFSIESSTFKPLITGSSGGILADGLNLSNGKTIVYLVVPETFPAAYLNVINPATMAVDAIYSHSNKYKALPAMAEVGGSVFVLQSGSSGDDKILVLSLSLALLFDITLTGNERRHMHVWGTKLVLTNALSDQVDIFDTVTRTVTSTYAINAGSGTIQQSIVVGNQLYAVIETGANPLLKQVNLTTSTVVHSKDLGDGYVINIAVDATNIYTAGTSITQSNLSNILNSPAVYTLPATERAATIYTYSGQVLTFADYPEARLRILGGNNAFLKFIEQYVLVDLDLDTYIQSYPQPYTGNAIVDLASTSVKGVVQLSSTVTNDPNVVPHSQAVYNALTSAVDQAITGAATPLATDTLAGKSKLVNSLSSTATDAALAAVKGKELNEAIVANSAAITLKVDIDTPWTQVGHGLTKGTITRLNGSNRVAALAANTLVAPATNLEQNQEVYSYVNSVTDANNIRESTGGNVDITGVLDHIGNPLVVGTKYYLSATVAGKMTANPPASPGQSERFVLIPKSSTIGRFTTADQGREIGPVAVLLNSDVNGVGTVSADGVLDKAMRTFLVDTSTGFRTVELPKCSDFPNAMEVVINIKISGGYGALPKPNTLTTDTIRGGNVFLYNDGDTIQYRRIGPAEWGVFAYTNPDTSLINALIFG